MSVTISDIAKRAGTSTATVSHVIHRTRFVSEDLRERVEKAMKAYHYPLPSRKVSVGFLLRGYSRSISENLIDSLNCYFGGRIELVAILVPPVITLKELKIYQRRYQLDFIILGHTVKMKRDRNHREIDLPIIFLNHDTEEYPLCYHINFDYPAAMSSALSHLFSLGHRYIAVIGSTENPYANCVLWKPVKDFMQNSG